MSKADVMHHLIDSNLSLLSAAGHHIKFTKKMFMERKPGFEEVGHALLMIIDAEECKRKIPWPLLNDKAKAREFRTNFSQFIKMINSKYKEAKIPEINASSLQFPGGMKFIEFMYKLSSFTLELELKRVSSGEDKEDFLPRPVDSKNTDSLKAKLPIVRGALYKEKELLNKFNGIALEHSSLLNKMGECSIQLKTSITSQSEQLKLEISTLDVDEKTKGRLLDIKDTDSIEEYNVLVEKKYNQLEESTRRLKELDELADKCVQVCQQIPEEPLCLDGYNLGASSNIYEVADEPIVTANGSLKLVQFLKSAQAVFLRLTNLTTSSDSPLTAAKDLQARSKSVAVRSHKVQSVLRKLLLETQQTVEKLRPLTLSNVDSKLLADTLYFQELPPLNFVLPKRKDNQLSRDSGKPRQRTSFGAIIRRKNTYVCSYKMKHDRVASTPIFKAPSSRKSLFVSSVSSGSKRKQTKEKKKQLQVTLDIPTLSTPNYPSKLERSSSSCLSTKTSSPQKASPMRSKRKSINDIVERYLRLKQSMNTSTNISTSESGTNCEDLE